MKKGNHKKRSKNMGMAFIGLVVLGLLIFVVKNTPRVRVTEDSYVMPKTTGMDMQELYDNAKKCVVGISMKQSVGSGILWEINQDEVVIISNKHLLMEDVEGTVTFWNGEELTAEIMAYSQQQDIGFLKISSENISDELMQELYVVRHPQNTGADADEIWWTVGEPVLQIGYIQKEEVHFEGEVKGMQFIPTFNENMLQTICYAKAGMSGGAVFDRYGNLLGMISGGVVEEEAKERETEVTYSIPVEVLETEFELESKRSLYKNEGQGFCCITTSRAKLYATDCNSARCRAAIGDW